jgi:hypothetical protein
VNTGLGVDFLSLYSRQTIWIRANKKIRIIKIKRNACENTLNDAEGKCADISIEGSYRIPWR